MKNRTIHLISAVEIDQPAESVWEIVADYTHDPAWRRGVQTMAPSTDGTVVVGTTTAEILRFAGRTWHNDGEVVAVEPGRGFAWRTTSGAQAEGSRRVEAVGDRRSRVTLELSVEPRRSERLMAPLLRRMLARNLDGDGQRLAELLGASAGVPAEA